MVFGWSWSKLVYFAGFSHTWVVGEGEGGSIQKDFRNGLGPSCATLHGASASSSGFGDFFIFPAGRFFRPSPHSLFQNHHRGVLVLKLELALFYVDRGAPSARGNFAC